MGFLSRSEIVPRTRDLDPALTHSWQTDMVFSVAMGFALVVAHFVMRSIMHITPNEAAFLDHYAHEGMCAGETGKQFPAHRWIRVAPGLTESDILNLLTVREKRRGT